jgi:hypothetical protein
MWLIKIVFLQSIDCNNFVMPECFQLFTLHYYCITHYCLKYRLFFLGGGGGKPYWLFNLQYLNWHSSYILKELEIAQEECSLVLWVLIWIQIWIQPHQDAFLCSCVINIHTSSETHHSCLCPYSESFQFEDKFTNFVFLKKKEKALFTWEFVGGICQWALNALYMCSRHCNTVNTLWTVQL